MREKANILRIIISLVGVFGFIFPIDTDLYGDEPSVSVLLPNLTRQFQVDSFLFRPEVTPIVVGVVGGRRTYIHPGDHSMLSRPSGNDNLIIGDVRPSFAASQQVIRPARFSSVNSLGVHQPSTETDGQDDATGNDIWNYTYDGAFGAALDGNTLYVVRHNEHQNLQEGPGFPVYQGNVVPGRDANVSGQRAGFWGANGTGGFWVNDWNQGGSYSSFVSFGKITLDPTNGDVLNYVDYGPITWPSKGFLASDPGSDPAPFRPNTGHELPTLFLPGQEDDPSGGNWMYTYFVNQSDTVGVGQGISVSRALVGDESGNAPPAWTNWNNGNWDTASVPADMRFDDMENHYVKTWEDGEFEAETIVYDQGTSSTWFQVAKLLDDNGDFSGHFVGVEGRQNPLGIWQMGLRFSTNLVDWSDIQVLYDAPSWWGTGDFTYPRLLSADGTTNQSVRQDGFFIVGLNPSEGDASPLHMMKVRVDGLIPVFHGDFNQDGIVDAADYTVWRDNLNGDAAVLNGNGSGGPTVTSADYDLWVTNYGNSTGGSQAVPEPSSLLLIGSGGVLMATVRKRQRHHLFN